MDIIKKRWKEIVVFLAIILIGVLLYLLINFLLSKKDDALLAQEIAERKYNNILSGETSEAILEKELENIISEKERMAEILPENYRIQDANADLIEIIKNTKILDIYDCEVNEITPSEGDKYKKFEIKVKKFYGTYNQLKDFIDFIENYKMKAVIKNMEFEREELTNNMNGKNLTITLYGII